MRPDLPSKFVCKSISADTTLTTHDVALNGLFVVASGGLTLTLPSPQTAIDGAECLIVSRAGSPITVSCSNGFLADLDFITLASGAGVLLYCTRLSADIYRWAAVGATPATA